MRKPRRPYTVRRSCSHIFVLNENREIVCMVPKAKTLELPASLRSAREMSDIAGDIIDALLARKTAPHLEEQTP